VPDRTIGYIGCTQSFQSFAGLEGGEALARYIQKISLVPFSAQELWVGWELEGIDGNVAGLIYAESMSEVELKARGVVEFQRIPHHYLLDFDPIRGAAEV
jgi:hypothetical protein